MLSTETANKKILIITYYWPPAGGPGVQRWLKFTKYLPEFGFKPYILTVDENSASYAITDKSLFDEISQELTIYRTQTKELFKLYLKLTKKKTIPFSGFVHEGKTGFKEKTIRFIRTHLFIPDPRKGWNRYALRKAIEIIKQERITYIVTTSPPHSTQLIGLQLKKIFPSITWMADFRDPWTHIFYFDQLNHTLLSRRIHKNMEKNVISRADKVVVVSRSMKKDFLKDHKKVTEGKIFTIPNGYDEEDFTGNKPLPDDDFTITYTGTLASNYRIDALIKAVSEINRTTKKKVKLRFVGEICQEYQTQLQKQLGPELYEVIPPVSHKQAIEYLFRSHMLLLVIPDALRNESIITGKLFEYIAARKLILGIGPVEGDASEILLQTKAGKMIDYNNIEAIKAEILQVIQDVHQNKIPFRSENIESFSRRMLTSKLLSLLGKSGTPHRMSV